MRVTLVFLAVIAISIINAAVDAVPTSISTTTSTGLVDPIDTVLDDTNNKRFLRSGRELKDKNIDDEEERNFVNKLGNLLGINSKAKSKIGASAEQLKAASKKLKITPEQVQAVSRKRKAAAEQVQAVSRKRKAAAEQVTAAAKRQKTTPNIPEHLRITPEQLMGLGQGRTSTVFAKWAKHKVLPDNIKPMLQGLSKSDRKQVYDWYKNDIFRGGMWNVR